MSEQNQDARAARLQEIRARLEAATPGKRAGLRRKKPLGRTRMGRGRSKRSAKSQRQLFWKRRDKAFTDWVRGQSCILLEHRRQEATYTGTVPPIGPRHWCGQPVQVCHVKSRGAGGADRANVVPMCAGAHDEQHRIGLRSFEKRHGINLQAEAAYLWARYQQGLVGARYVAEVGAGGANG